MSGPRKERGSDEGSGLPGIKDLAVEEVETPRAGPEDVVVAVAACGICGSDLHTYLHGSFVEPGQVMGHEFVGEVVEAGADVQGISVGDRVTASPLVPCNECARCAEGRYNLCGKAWTQGLAYGRPGAFAEMIRIPGSIAGENVFPLGDDVSDEAGALVEPLAVAVHAVKLAEPVRVPRRSCSGSERSASRSCRRCAPRAPAA